MKEEETNGKFLKRIGTKSMLSFISDRDLVNTSEGKPTHSYKDTRTTIDRFLVKGRDWREEGVIPYPLSNYDIIVLKTGETSRNITFWRANAEIVKQEKTKLAIIKIVEGRMRKFENEEPLSW